MIIMNATALILLVLYFSTNPALVTIRQSKEIAAAGAVYSRGLIPQLFAFSIYCPMQRFLQAVNIVSPLDYISVGTFLLHILLTWVGVNKLGFGLLGVALILSLSWWILVIATVLYIIYNPYYKHTWTGFTLMTFTGFWSYFKLTIASAFMLVISVNKNVFLTVTSNKGLSGGINSTSLKISKTFAKVRSGGVVFFALFEVTEGKAHYSKEAVAVMKFSSSRMATQSERLGYEFARRFGVQTTQEGRVDGLLKWHMPRAVKEMVSRPCIKSLNQKSS